MASSPEHKRIFNYGCWLLARRRYSESEFRKKLDKKFPDQIEATTAIIENFLARKYLDDTQYTELYIREQLNRKPQGLRVIKQKLRQKGINETTLSAVFQNQLVTGISENELAIQALAKKTALLDKASHAKIAQGKIVTPQQRKQKLFRFLASRGFSPDTIMRALKS